ncbi:SICA antigen [Plasmodium coatneyi]|uniref:SICA antigen n=1 Tax=Plasmodium coatneyi TaxID=208452 RepID=A0A1B1E220_9APIC|nr:SICA antigen [Plasmodium coatneyi]ANQ09081.1 SICA antigen [Plasmodium coatneyi]
MDHGIDHSGPYKYTLVKKRIPRSVPTGTKVPKKRVGSRAVGHRTIIDIHLEVLDECQKWDLHSTKKDFFEILVEEFMVPEFIKDEKVTKEDFVLEEYIPKDFVPMEHLQSSDSGFEGGRLCS